MTLSINEIGVDDQFRFWKILKSNQNCSRLFGGIFVHSLCSLTQAHSLILMTRSVHLNLFRTKRHNSKQNGGL